MHDIDEDWIARQRAAGLCPAQVFNALREAGLAPEGAATALAAAAPGLDAQHLATLLRPAPSPRFAAPSVALHDRAVRLLWECRRPHLALFDGLLSTPECDALIQMARPVLAPSTVVDMEGRTVVLDSIRSSWSARFRAHENALAQQVVQRAAALLDWPATHFEHLVVLRYGTGQEYRAHQDYIKPGTRSLQLGGQRVATLLVYLNTPPRGGSTSFPDLNLEVQAVRGQALFFAYPSASRACRTLHAGRPVLDGEKWVAVLFLRQGAYTPTPWPSEEISHAHRPGPAAAE